MKSNINIVSGSVNPYNVTKLADLASGSYFDSNNEKEPGIWILATDRTAIRIGDGRRVRFSDDSMVNEVYITFSTTPNYLQEIMNVAYNHRIYEEIPRIISCTDIDIGSIVMTKNQYLQEIKPAGSAHSNDAWPLMCYGINNDKYSFVNLGDGTMRDYDNSYQFIICNVDVEFQSASTNKHLMGIQHQINFKNRPDGYLPIEYIVPGIPSDDKYEVISEGHKEDEESKYEFRDAKPDDVKIHWHERKFALPRWFVEDTECTNQFSNLSPCACGHNPTAYYYGSTVYESIEIDIYCRECNTLMTAEIKVYNLDIKSAKDMCYQVAEKMWNDHMKENENASKV